MELLFVILGGIILGILARYTLPWRDTHGIVLLPAVGGAFAAVVWVALTWLGWAWDGGWIWWVSLGSAVVAVYLLGIFLGRARERGDERMRAKLGL